MLRFSMDIVSLDQPSDKFHCAVYQLRLQKHAAKFTCRRQSGILLKLADQQTVVDPKISKAKSYTIN